MRFIPASDFESSDLVFRPIEDFQKQPLPEGVKPSEAGGGRGSAPASAYVRPPEARAAEYTDAMGNVLGEVAPEPATVSQEPGMISRAWQATKGTVSSIAPALIEKVTPTQPQKSVLEGYQPSAQEQQAEVDRRLSYGAGPINQNVVARADLARSGLLKTEDARVRKVAEALTAQGQTSFGQLAEMAKDKQAAEESKRGELDYLTSSLERGWNGLNLAVNGQKLATYGELLDSFNEAYTPEQIAADPKLQAELKIRQEGFEKTSQENAQLTKANQEIMASSRTRPETKLMMGVGVKDRGWLDAAADFGKAMVKDPGSVVDLALSSGPSSLASMATAAITYLGTRNPRLAAAAGGAGSGYVEFGNEYSENRDAGMTHAEAWKAASLKAGVVGALDAVSMNTAGKALDTIAEALRVGATKTALKTVGVETLKQGALGGLGEAGGALAAGKEIDPTNVLAEIVGETVSAPVEAVSTRGRLAKAITPESQFANAFAQDVAGAQYTTPADEVARRIFTAVQSYDTNIITPQQTAKMAQAGQGFGKATSAEEVVDAANLMAGSVDELLVPNTIVPPTAAAPTLPVMPEATAPAELPPIPGLPAAPAPAPLPAVNPETEKLFGLDKLRLNAPRPQSIQGEPVANLTDDKLTEIVNDESVHAMTRRGAAIELTARQAEQAPAVAPIETAPIAAPTPTVEVPSTAAKTLTPAELGQMRLGDRRTLARDFDQTENDDGSITFTPKPASAVPVAAPETNFGLGAAQGRVSNAPVTGTGDTARADLQARLDETAAQHNVAVPTLAAPAKSDEAAVTAIGKALGVTGPVVAYADPNGADGFELGGAIAINTKTEKGIAPTAFHENFHIAERIAEADTQAGRTDTPAQQYVSSIHSLFDDMSEAGKRSYAENFLHKKELASIADPVAREQRLQQLLSGQTLRSEMAADFMGNRATDRTFLADLAKADPKGFGGFVQKWIGILDNMLVRLRGVKDKTELESVKVDSYLKDLNQAKMVARDAMVAFRNGTLQQSAPATAPLAFSQQQGETNERINVTPGGEVAPGLAGTAGQVPALGGGGEIPSYGTAREGAVSVVGRHYSTTPRQSLSGAYYGRGLKGAEATRLDASTDPRLKNRVYFYADQGAGIRPESGVGGHAHEVQLNNIYDPASRLIKPQADANAFESAVINAGFDGYMAPFGNNQSAVVLLGQKHKAVPVRAIGQPLAAAAPQAAAPTTLTKGLLSREANAIDVGNIPGAQVRMGNLQIPAGQTEAANAELARIGSDVRFAKKQKGEMVGEYQVNTEKDGSIKVTGNPEEIRALMPEGVIGRALADGVAFTNANAPRVRAALEGRNIAYSRGGTVLERLPVKNGKYLGAPEKFNTPAKIPKLRRWLRQLAIEGAAGRYWYENSGREVLKMVGGDVQEARKFVALLAIYSPQAKVDANSTFALRAWSQYKAGQPINVKTGVMDSKAKAAMDNVDEFWSGEKTGNFFFNLLREIDPSTAGKQGATIDMWMMRAGQYDNDAPTSTQYAFMEHEANRLAKELGWEPQQVQAAIWVAMKARMENSGVKKATEASSEKKNWIRFENKTDAETGKKKKVRVILNEKAHRDNWLKHSFEHDPSAEDTQLAKFDFGDGLKRHIGQVSFEARPGRSTGVLPGIHNAPYAQQVEFQQAVQAAFLDETGADRLAQLLGLLVDTHNVLAPGVWQGEISPSSQKLVAMAPAKGPAGQKEVDEAQAQALNLYAAAAGLVAKQEGVGWHRPFYAGTKRDANALDINLGRVISPTETADLEKAVGVWMADNGKTAWQDSFAFISSPEGVRLVNFGIIDNPTLQSDIVKVAESVLPDFDYRVFASSGDMPTNNWKENPNGESYIQRFSAAGRSDVLDWARTVLAPRVQRVFDEYSKKYNWGDPGSISFSQRQQETSSIEPIFAGLDKRGMAKAKAEAAFTARPDGAQIKFVQDNFLDILAELDDSGLVKINCD